MEAQPAGHAAVACKHSLDMAAACQLLAEEDTGDEVSETTCTDVFDASSTRPASESRLSRWGRNLRLALLMGSLVAVLVAAALMTSLSTAAGRSNEGEVATARPARAAASFLAAFSMMQTFKEVLQTLGIDPFRFRCPLPLMPLNQTTASDPRLLVKQCCETYARWQLPYQFPECHDECPTCGLQASRGMLSQSPVAGLAAVAWASAVAVQGAPALMSATGPDGKAAGMASAGQEDLASDGSVSKQQLSEMGLTGHNIIAQVDLGLRSHDTDVCPRIDDWQVFMLNENGENIHARVYKSPSSKLAVVAFRGTQADSLKNWAVDVDIRTRLVNLGDPEDPSVMRAEVHEGFLFAVERVLPEVKKWVTGVGYGTGAVPYGWKLVFAGHSLGGALATLAATLAEVEGWVRKPDAVVTFGAPRVGDQNLNAWWQKQGLCERLLRVNVYNDVVHWMPFAAGAGWWADLGGCVGDLQSCFLKSSPSSAALSEELQFSDRWQHVCPDQEYLVPGAMKGINVKLEDFSPLGGVLTHFIGNGLFGYGYGLLNSGIVLHDERCGLTPEIFPGSVCAAIEDLSGQECLGLRLDAHAEDANACQEKCCDDEWCEVWQFTRGGQCWRGRSQDCRSDTAGAREVLLGQRMH
eukprot:TRINITY_DN25362_c0_g1_i1.p1 TRINITY_DN25362_c0_g1~~TRINITY_DN25362_c0_g1_i1.p1  ORF type:complete len:637 (+),score=150.08 TRINITY_DN25362_c0_g1_i1:80-1990(+)